ncbi:hypothetical protein DPSP01_010133 [Paraphaeosphaeria sporulosa]|uniref:Uncharacterized protein n=1 Tax=Paraphaeosphaeria sporulosa TaxID=1460663 RepID=A0A177CYJ0_9PLEO|nr:uncharacterized protein CC84DRAFT_130089 [Paraphaeosphaeria sporulosa]OAG12614.1 hypothetical protein CC84DRAFT_130089 [Paraphaeosphaeria sporulosa]
MSASAGPISPARFAAALESLSVSSLHAKAAELRNSIAHLEKSNAELEEYVQQDQDKDLYEAILENREVIKRMEERIELVKKEVTEVRCLPWAPEEAGASELGERESGGVGRPTNGVISGGDGAVAPEPTNGAGTAGDGEEEGVFL